MSLRFRDLMSGTRALAGILSSKWVFGGPRSVAIAVCDVCNTDCLMCWYHSPLVRGSHRASAGSQKALSSRRPQHMDPTLIETIIRESRETGTYRVVLCGDGEPSLHPQLDQMLELMKRLDMEPYVITNGLAVDQSRARLWAKVPAHFRFSLQAGDEETWLRVHPGGRPQQFKRLSRTIRTLVEARTPRVSTMHVIHKANYRHVREMVEHARELGVREVLFRPIRARGAVVQQVLGQEEERELRGLLRECLELATAYGIRTNLREYLSNSLHIRSGVSRTAHLYRKIPCYIGWIYAEFDIEGNMVPCLNSQIVMGRAGKQSIREMWLSPRYQNFRREARSMPRRGTLVEGCVCHACPMAKYNTNVHGLLRLRSLSYGEA